MKYYFYITKYVIVLKMCLFNKSTNVESLKRHKNKQK